MTPLFLEPLFFFTETPWVSGMSCGVGVSLRFLISSATSGRWEYRFRGTGTCSSRYAGCPGETEGGACFGGSGASSFHGSQSVSGTTTGGRGDDGLRWVTTTDARAGLSPPGIPVLKGAPQRLQKPECPVGSGAPQEGHARPAGAVFRWNVVPQRVQNSDWLSTAGLPQEPHTGGTGTILVPQRLQNRASSSETTAPHPGQTGYAGPLSSGTAAPHRLQNRAWSSSAGCPQVPQVFAIIFP